MRLEQNKSLETNWALHKNDTLFVSYTHIHFVPNNFQTFSVKKRKKINMIFIRKNHICKVKNIIRSSLLIENVFKTSIF